MLKSSKRKALGAVLAATLLALMFASTTFAADFKFGENKNAVLEIPQSETVRNLYTAGGQVIVKANPLRDLVVAGGSLDIDGNVGSDLLAAGGNINVRGNVGGSARVAGGNVRFYSKTIGEDLVIGGGTVYVSSETVVNGDLLVAGGSVYIDGKVNGDVRAQAGHLVLGPNANIAGDVYYISPNPYQRDANAKVGGTVSYTQSQRYSRGSMLGILSAAFVIKVLAELIAAFLLLWLLKNSFKEAVQKVGFGFWRNAAYGLLGLILGPVVIGALFVTIVGSYAALMLLLVYVLLLLAAAILSASYFGTWVYSKVYKRERGVNYATVAAGIILFSLIKAIPIAGGIFALVLVLAGLGSFLRHYRHSALN